MKKVLSSVLAISALLTSLVGCGGAQPVPNAAMLRSRAMNPMLQAQAARPGLRRFNAAEANASNGKLRIATYNIRNLFDGVQNPGKEPEKAKPEKELVELAAAIHEINADVIGLQEVESKETLTAYRDKYLADMGYREVVLIEANDARGIDVAILSRYPVSDVKTHRELRFEVPGQGTQGFSRDVLQARIQGPNNYNFTIFVNHLKSHHGEDAADVKRRAEAEQASQIIRAFQQANPQENVVVMGDMNDPYNSPHIAPLVNPQVSGLGLHDIIHEDLGAADWVFTYHPQKYRSRIDFILLNENMKREYIAKSVKLYKPFKEGDQWQKLHFYNGSDHIPVTVDLDISQDR